MNVLDATQARWLAIEDVTGHTVTGDTKADVETSVMFSDHGGQVVDTHDGIVRNYEHGRMVSCYYIPEACRKAQA